MSTDVTTRTSSTAVAPAHDPYATYGASAGNKLFLGFKESEWCYGKDKDELPLGTRLVANMPELTVGYRRWQDNKVIDSIMVPLLGGTKPPRDSLGCLDQALWPLDDQGKPRDPWQETNELPLKALDGDKEFVYSASSWGGLNAIKLLCKAYGPVYRQKPGQFPIVELARESYIHDKWGKKYKPILKLVDWASEAALLGVDPNQGALPIGESGSASTGKKARF